MPFLLTHSQEFMLNVACILSIREAINFFRVSSPMPSLIPVLELLFNEYYTVIAAIDTI